MAVTPVPSMTDTPSFPALSDRAAGDYNSKAFAFGTHMADKFNGELVAVAQNVAQNAAWAEAKATAADAAALSAQSAMELAAAGVDAAPWVSGRTYAKNAAAISQVNFQIYRRTVAGAGTTDPADDTANVWAPQFGNGSFTPRAAATATFDLSAGNFFARTMTANEAWVFDKCPSNGFSFTVELTLSAGVLTLPTSVKTPADVVYTLTAGKTHLLMFVTSNRGARWRMVVASNYTS